MRKSAIVLLILASLVIILLFVYKLKIQNNELQAQKKNFQKQLGLYILDLNKTTLGLYCKDSLLYSKLQISFMEDSTFIMNMKVPFIFDSIGTWLPAGGGLEEWNRLFYSSWKYEDIDIHSGNQFTQPWTTDSIFYINGATPRAGADFIQEIYFKKVRY